MNRSFLIPGRSLRKIRPNAKKQTVNKIVRCMSLVATIFFLDSLGMQKMNSRYLLADRATKELYSRDRGCTSRENKLVYVHLPKTGGTTIERTSLFKEAALFHQISGHYSVDQMMYNSEDRQMDDFVTAVHVRHPCERYISAFYYLKDGKGNKGDTQWAKEHIGDRSIDEFTQLQKENDWEDLKFWLHFFPMAYYLMHDTEEKIEFGVDEVLCQEQWDEGINRLYDAVDKKVPEFLLDSTRKDGKEKTHALHNTHESCADLDPKTRALIEEYYALDYCLLGYPSIPDYESTTCLGTGKNRTYFTKRYRVDCKDLHQNH